MKLYRFLFPLIAAAAFTACEVEDPYYGKPVDPDPEAYLRTPYQINWNEAADSTSFEFVKQFFYTVDKNNRNYGVFTFAEYDRRDNNTYNYWVQAHTMNVMLDFYERIKAGKTTSVLEAMNADPNASLSADDTSAEILAARAADQLNLETLEKYFSLWFDKHGNNWEGNASWRGPAGFGNDYSDDTSWIIQALCQMYDATGDQKYYDAAKTTYDVCIAPRWDNVEGGYPWMLTKLDVKNDCTNGPVCINECRFALYAKEAGDEEAYEYYKARAIRTFEFLSSTLFDSESGRVGSLVLSYTQGAFMEAGRLLYHLTGDLRYLRDATRAAWHEMTAPGAISDGLMRDEGSDENNAIFKAVFFHYAGNMILDESIDKLDPTFRKQLYNFVKFNASCAWTLGIDKTTWPNSYFDVYYKQRRAAYGGSQGAQGSACTALEVMAKIHEIGF